MKENFLLLFFTIFIQYSYAQQSTLSIKIIGIKEAKGIIQVGIYDDKNTFPKIGKEYRVEYFI